MQEAAKEAGDQAPTAKQIQKAAAKTKGNQSTVSALKLVAAEEQEPAEHDELQADDQSAPDQTERADTKPGRTKIPLPVILEWVQDLWRELDQMEGAEEACALISRIERELGRYVPDNQEEEVAA